MTGPTARTAAISAIVCILLLSCPASSQNVSDPPVVGQIEAYLKPFVDTGNFTGAILVARKKRVIFRRAYGMANYELLVPNSPDTRFHIASVSKPFTAMAVLQLQEQGRLNVTDLVAKFVPNFPNGDRITLEHLLTHTSGIPNVNDLPDYDTFARSPHTPAELVAKFANLPLDFQPGTDYRYSNSNYNLLALILENVSGEPYGDYLKKHILEPAGMKDTGHDGDALRLNPLAASGYEPVGVSSYEKAPYLDWTNKTGNGSLYSTLDDLYRFDRALNTDTLLKKSTRDQYFVEGKGNRFGWFQRKRAGHRVMSSNGRSPGFTAQLDRFPDEDATVIVLSNSYSTVSQDPIAVALGAIVLGDEPEQPPALQAASISRGTLESYAGQYQYGPDYFVPNARVTITVEENSLLLTIGTFRMALVPLSTTEFLDRTFLGHVVISLNDKGKAAGFTYRYSGRDFVAHRVDAR